MTDALSCCQMRSLARERRAKSKADAAIPDWIKEADAAKPASWRDLGWRALPPCGPVHPSRYGRTVDTASAVVFCRGTHEHKTRPPQKTAALSVMNRPKSGSGTPFCPGGSGGRWRAPPGWQSNSTCDPPGSFYHDVQGTDYAAVIWLWQGMAAVRQL